MMIIDKTKPILVTGATGYVAGRIVELLINNGHTVHATVRNADNVDKLGYLNDIANKSSGKIVYFSADLLRPGTYFDAMQGCELVYHTASPFLQSVKDPQKDLIEPALEGTRNMLDSVNKTETVKRVVLTSSVAAIYGDAADLQTLTQKSLTENDWNISSSPTHQPYSYSKTVAEKEAWQIAKDQSRWDLVVINPSLVLGPGINPKGTSESFNLFKQLVDGSTKFGAPDFNLGAVDVRDLALAHYNAGFFPEASGRHIVSAQTVNFLVLADFLRQKYGNKLPLPKRTLPKFLVWLMAPAVGFSRKMIAKNVGYSWEADNSKSIQKLKITYRPMSETVLEFFEQMLDSGQVTLK